MMAVFEKGARLRHIGHLDIQRAMQRALRRSGLPVSYSKGFNPHILLTFASALSTGAMGEKEIMDVTLDAPVETEAFMTAMNAALPPDMQLSSAKPMEDKHPALMAMVCAADYELTLQDDVAAHTLAQAMEGFLAQESIMAVRRSKSGMKECDIRPLIHELHMEGHTLTVRLTLQETSICKPDMLMAALSAFAGIEVPRVLVNRKGLLGEQNGAFVPLETL
ncbi:MAG: TIGR03936 family radical SAM-associated protein [Aristaeellaceae bacterium]